MLEPWLVVLAAVVGYLCGSISMARIVVKLVAPHRDISRTDIRLESSGQDYHLDAVAGTAVSLQLGARWGGITAILDILKALIPTLVFRLLYPETPYAIIVALAAVVGHDWPIYHGFKGGRGISPIYGGLLAIDPLGALAMSLLGMALGLVVLRNVVVAFLSGLWLMIPWFWFRTHSWMYLAYGVGVNLLFMVAMIPEFRQIMAFRKAGVQGDINKDMEYTPMLRMMKKMGVRLGLFKNGT
jgi:glycerol-3-phosphate acyltransferase PlsY